MAKALVALQLLALVFVGVVTVARFHVWAEVDERPHYAYIQTVAEDHRLPRIEDLVSPEVQAITDRTWPRTSPTDPATIGLAGRNYEAFQPPLYYVVAAPAFLAVSDHHDKVYAVRAFDLLLMLVSVWLLWLLARAWLPAAPLPAFAAGLSVVLWPGIVGRAVTVSPSSLELIVTLALLLALTRAEATRSSRALLSCGALLGVCLLTKLTLTAFIAPFALVLWRAWRSGATVPLRVLAASAALPAVVLSPWLISNLVRLGALTANRAAQRQQTPLLYPHGNDFGLDDVANRIVNLPDGVLPLEWEHQLGVWWVGLAVLVLVLPLVAGAVVLAWRRAPTVLQLPGLVLLASLAIAILTAATAHWDVFLLRYYTAALAPLAVALAAYVVPTRGERPVLLATTAATVLTGLLWLDMAGAFYFTDLGAKIGI